MPKPEHVRQSNAEAGWTESLVRLAAKLAEAQVSNPAPASDPRAA